MVIFQFLLFIWYIPFFETASIISLLKFKLLYCRIIAVAFFGLLGHTFSADADTTTLDSSECPDVKTKAMKDFKPEKVYIF